MSQFIDQNFALEVVENGVMVGSTTPSTLTKMLWWQVYIYKNSVFACLFSEKNGVVCGDELLVDDLWNYSEDTDSIIKAKELLGLIV